MKSDYKKIRKFIFSRNIKRFKNEYNWNYKFFSSPYRKIKTIFNLEISSYLLYLLYKTNISANQVSLLGVIWTFLGTTFIYLNTNLTILIGLFFYFTKLIPDYIDGSLAHLKKEFSKTGYEIDLWAGEASKILLLSGILLHIYLITSENIYLLILTALIVLNLLDPRKHLSLTKFGNTTYSKKLLAHVAKKDNNSNKIFSFLKFINFNARSYYTDILIFLIIINLIYELTFALKLLPFVWLTLSSMAFIRAIWIVFKKK